MKHVPVVSSMIASVGHDADTNTLEVRFNNGRVYTYTDVPVDAFDALVDAPSVGKHFLDNIRDQYRAG